MHFINWCTWKSSQYYIIISMMTSFMRMSQKLVFHQSKCICAIKRILSTTAMYVSSSSFMYLRFPCYCDACLNSSDLRVGLKTLLNTIQWSEAEVLKSLGLDTYVLRCFAKQCSRFRKVTGNISWRYWSQSSGCSWSAALGKEVEEGKC